MQMADQGTNTAQAAFRTNELVFPIRTNTAMSLRAGIGMVGRGPLILRAFLFLWTLGVLTV